MNKTIGMLQSDNIVASQFVEIPKFTDQVLNYTWQNRNAYIGFSYFPKLDHIFQQMRFYTFVAHLSTGFLSIKQASLQIFSNYL